LKLIEFEECRFFKVEDYPTHTNPDKEIQPPPPMHEVTKIDEICQVVIKPIQLTANYPI